MTKERILFVGQHPDAYTGNGNMLYACLQQVDREKYDICAFVQGETPVELMKDPFSKEDSDPCTYISAQSGNDIWGKQKLINLLHSLDIDQLVFVGIDIWRYTDIFDHIEKIKAKREFVWKVIVPYDLTHVRDDWVQWLNRPDYVFVYSKYGYEMLKKHVKNLSYFRPTVRDKNLYLPEREEDRKTRQKQLFPDITDDVTVFGFIGANQIRKNILKMLRGFSLALRERKKQTGKEDMILYMHMDTVKGVFNVEQIAKDIELPDAVLRHNGQSRKFFPREIAVMYRAFDVHLLFSMQEGLSWTVIESKLAGTPSIISNTTAHLDYYIKSNGIIHCVPDTEDMLPLMTESGPAYVRTESCSSKAICNSILQYMAIKNKKKLREDAANFGAVWCSTSDDISKVLEQKIEKHSDLGEEV